MESGDGVYGLPAVIFMPLLLASEMREASAPRSSLLSWCSGHPGQAKPPETAGNGAHPLLHQSLGFGLCIVYGCDDRVL